MLRSSQAIGLMLLALAGVGGCGPQAFQATVSRTSIGVDKSKYLLSEEPEGAVGVMIAREEANDQDDIVLVGRIGGRRTPWIEGRSAFMVIDAAMTVVPDGEESSEDQICLDECCAALRTSCTTLVKIVDERGKPLAIDARELLGIQENEMVVVQGVVHRDEQNSAFTVVASGVYVRK